MSTETNFMVIDVEPTGVVTAMHRDAFSLAFLGKQDIQRASEIVFNAETQHWDVKLRNGSPHEVETGWSVPSVYLSHFVTYDSARKFEVLYLESCALQSIAPRSQCGIELAAGLRATYGDFDQLMASITKGMAPA